MSRVYQMPDRDQIYDEASVWISRLDRGLSGNEIKELRNWLSRSKLHRETLFKMAELWDKMDSLSRLSDMFPQGEKQRLSGLSPKIAMAACLLAAVLLGSLYYPGRWATGIDYDWAVNTEKHAVTYQTAVGEKIAVDLPDGSKMVLNTNSLIGLRYNAKERAIDLLQGEAHFTVAHDRSRPFTVYIGDKAVRAVGTAFNIERLASGFAEVIVTEGKVVVAALEARIKDTASQSQIIPKTRPKQKLITLSRGEEILLDNALPKAHDIQSDDVAAALAWRQGNLIFRGETLESAVQEISRYTSVKLEIVDEGIKNIRIAGVFVAGDIDGLLIALEEGFNIQSHKVGNERILLGESS